MQPVTKTDAYEWANTRLVERYEKGGFVVEENENGKKYFLKREGPSSLSLVGVE